MTTDPQSALCQCGTCDHPYSVHAWPPVPRPSTPDRKTEILQAIVARLNAENPHGVPVDETAAITAAVEVADAREAALQARIVEFVAASLETDYTVDHDCPEYADDAAEQAAALANIAEMHRLINVGHERLFDAHEALSAKGQEIAALQARIDSAVNALQQGGQSDRDRRRAAYLALTEGLLVDRTGRSDGSHAVVTPAQGEAEKLRALLRSAVEDMELAEKAIDMELKYGTPASPGPLMNASHRLRVARSAATLTGDTTEADRG